MYLDSITNNLVCIWETYVTGATAMKTDILVL